MREFAEAEIRLPNGQHEGRRFRTDRNPFTGLWFDAIDSCRWRRYVATGPTGSGKTLTAFIIPLMYHLFEIGETTLCGLPDLAMVADKWNDEILPVIHASSYRDLLPLKGPGSRGGDVTRVRFRNGATLRFMTGGSGDKGRAGFHCRPLVVTETDGFDESSASSREADKLTQLERRVSSYGDMARVYLECTVSTEEGRTWREFNEGTASRIALRCPHCSKYATPEREHLVGWRDAKDIVGAGEGTRVVCPTCGGIWNEAERHTANRDPVLVHRGQTLAKDGRVDGELPRTHTLGFRWTAVNNLLVNMAVVGEEEWKAARDPDEANAEKKMRQFVWAMPHVPDKLDLTALDSQTIAARKGEWPRGVVPPDAECLTVGIDLGGYLCHWTATAWRPGATPHVVDHGRAEVPRDGRAVELALLIALRSFRDDVLAVGWPVGRADSQTRMQPALSLYDAGWLDEVVLAFCEESGPGHIATKGFGAGQLGNNHRRTTGSKVMAAGEGYELVKLPSGQQILEVHADRWKAWLHARLKTPIGQAGGLTLFTPTVGDPHAHLSFSKHLTAEKQVEEYVAGKGLVTKYVVVSRHNHWLDSTALSCVGGHVAGARLIAPAAQPVRQPQPSSEPAGGWQPKTW